MKLMILGYAAHGKDTVSNLLRDLYGLSFISSSYFCMGKCVRKDLEAQGIYYDSDEACYADRIHHRDKWFNSIAAYNAGDPARLGRELFAEYDIYCGNRNAIEFEALKKEKAFDFAFWVDRGEHVEDEPLSSNTLYPSYADYVIDNNGDLDYLKAQVAKTYSKALRALHIG